MIFICPRCYIFIILHTLFKNGWIPELFGFLILRSFMISKLKRVLNQKALTFGIDIVILLFIWVNASAIKTRLACTVIHIFSDD